MAVWAIADLHLSFGVRNKEMSTFGPHWEGWTEKIAATWKERITEEDLVLIAGDISWATHLKDALPDLEWIDRLPGTKVMIRGNHDYWWSAISKVRECLPPSLHVIQHDAFLWNDIAVGGARLWDTPSISFGGFIDYEGDPISKKECDQAEKIYNREVERLKMSLQALDKQAKKRLIMTHYPPVGPHLKSNAISTLFEEANIDACIFGHLHNVIKEKPLFGTKNGIPYYLTSCDYLDFCPLKIL